MTAAKGQKEEGVEHISQLASRQSDSKMTLRSLNLRLADRQAFDTCARVSEVRAPSRLPRWLAVNENGVLFACYRQCCYPKKSTRHLPFHQWNSSFQGILMLWSINTDFFGKHLH